VAAAADAIAGKPFTELLEETPQPCGVFFRLLIGHANSVTNSVKNNSGP
jgi:hypothetical protein